MKTGVCLEKSRCVGVWVLSDSELLVGRAFTHTHLMLILVGKDISCGYWAMCTCACISTSEFTKIKFGKNWHLQITKIWCFRKQKLSKFRKLHISEKYLDYSSKKGNVQRKLWDRILTILLEFGHWKPIVKADFF